MQKSDNEFQNEISIISREMSLDVVIFDKNFIVIFWPENHQTTFILSKMIV